MPKISQYTELAETPASTDEFVIVDKSDTSEAASGTTKKIQAQYLTIADASTTVKGKVELATDAETITGTDTVRAVTPSNITAKQASDAEAITGTSTTKLITPANITASAPTFIAAAEHAATSKTTPVDADEIGLVDSAASNVLKKLTWANLKSTLGLPINISSAWPIGSVYIAVVSTNPSTLLGFGTWSAFATGRTLIGFDSGQTEFDAIEETGGAKTHTHDIQNSGVRTAYYGGVAGNTGTAPGADYLQASHDHPDTTAISHLPPYIVVYMWKRTA